MLHMAVSSDVCGTTELWCCGLQGLRNAAAVMELRVTHLEHELQVRALSVCMQPAKVCELESDTSVGAGGEEEERGGFRGRVGGACILPCVARGGYASCRLGFAPVLKRNRVPSSNIDYPASPAGTGHHRRVRRHEGVSASRCV